MVPRIWMTRVLCRNKPYRRLTADCCAPLGCAPLGYFTPQSVEDGQTIFPKLDWMRYWLSVGAQSSRDWCPSPLNLKRISIFDDSRADSEDNDSGTVLNTAAEECCDHSDASVVSARTAGPVIRRSSGLCALLLLQRSRTSSSVGLPFTRSLASNGTRSDSQLSDKEDKKLSPFVVIQGDTESLIRRIDAAIENKKDEFTEVAMKDRYKNYIRPQLSSRGLIIPDNLKHQSTHYIHFRTKDILGRRPLYMSALDVMGHEKRMKLDEWQQFLVYMIKNRIYVIEKWNSSLCHVESLMYDHGIIGPDDGTNVEFYKGECDASFDEDRMEARLAFLIFKGTGIFHCQVHYGVPCESSVVAEAYAAAACLMTAQEKGIKKMALWVDCEAIHGCLSGERNINLRDKNLGVFMMLREQKKSFDRMIPIWKERELNKFADELVTLDKEETLHRSYPTQAMNRWKLQLEGGPIFRFKQKKETTDIVKTFVDVKSYGRVSATSSVMLDVEQVSKLDCLLGLQDGFKPDDLYIVVSDFSKKPQDLQLKILELYGNPIEFSGKQEAETVEGASIFHKSSYSSKRPSERNSMTVLFDASLWRKSFQTSQLTVVLLSPEDSGSTARRHLRKLTALDYVQFSRVK